MSRFNKAFLIVTFLVLSAATLQPLEFSRNPAQEWLVDTAQNEMNLEGARPHLIHPALVSQAPELLFPRIALPPRELREADKNQILKMKSSETPTFIPQHFIQEDRSVQFHLEQEALTMAPGKLRSFKGLAETRFFPADSTIAVGPHHVLVATNSAVAIYSKRGKELLKASFGQWLANVTEITGAILFDPKVIYDQYTGHFILLIDALRDNDNRSWYVISVSKTSDALGDWVSYAFDMKLNGKRQSNNLADFPGLGVDEQAVYMTANMFSFSSNNFVYAKLRIVNKAKLYAFGKVPFFDRWAIKDSSGHRAVTIQPAHSYGPSPVEYLLSCSDESGNKLTLYNVPNGAAARPSLKKKAVNVSSFLIPPDADQKDWNIAINTGDAALRNVVFSGGSLYTAHAIAHNWGSGQVSAIRLYEISETSELKQEIIFGADKFFYYYPAITPDSRGNIVVVFNRSGKSEFVSIDFTGRRNSQPAGQLESAKLLKASKTYYFSTDSNARNRWGDYSGIALDSDDSVWIYGEYAETTSDWATQVARVKYR